MSGEVKICPQGTKNIAFLSSGDIMGQIPDWKHVPLVDQAIAHTDQELAVGISTRELDQFFRFLSSFLWYGFPKNEAVGIHFMLILSEILRKSSQNLFVHVHV